MVLDSIIIQSRAFALDEKDIKMEVEVMDAVASFVPDISSVNAKLKTHEGKQYTINGALLESYSLGWAPSLTRRLSVFSLITVRTALDTTHA